MINFIIKRILNGIWVLLGVAVVIFVIFKIMPGDPAKMMLGQRSDQSTIDALNKEYYLDQKLSVQFAYFINDISPISVHGDSLKNADKYNYTRLIPVSDHVLVVKSPYLGRSFQNQRFVSDIILDRFPSTAILALVAMIFATVIGVFFGVVSALNQNKFWDRFLVTLSVFGISVPSFVSAVLLGLLFAVVLRDFTGLNLFGSLYEYHAFEGKSLQLKNLILPAITLGIRPLAIIVQLTRSSMIEALGEDYIRTARSKGLSQNKVLYKHALRNALNPVVTAVSGWFAGLLAGAFFIEKVFNWKGLGLETINAVFNLDFPVVIGSTLFIGLIFIIISILVDIIYAWLDPRVRLH
jgi:ABC-type dipeptide/oligopeptide/nickel transport system permease component